MIFLNPGVNWDSPINQTLSLLSQMSIALLIVFLKTWTRQDSWDTTSRMLSCWKNVDNSEIHTTLVWHTVTYSSVYLLFHSRIRKRLLLKNPGSTYTRNTWASMGNWKGPIHQIPWVGLVS